MYLLKLLKKKVRNMSRIKISELADEFKIDRKDVLAKAQEFGVSAKLATKTLSESEEKQLRTYYQQVPHSMAETSKNQVLENVGQKKLDPKEEVSEKKEEPSKAEQVEKKKSKFSILGHKKSEKKKGKLLTRLSNEKPPSKKQFTAKQGGALVVGGVGILILSNMVLFGLMASGYQPTQKIIHEQVSASQKVSGNGLDLQAKNYLDGFVQTYFTFPENEKDQEQAVKDINGYFVQQLPVISQGLQRSPSKFEEAVLMNLTDNEATYKVTYGAGAVTKKGKSNVVNYHDVTTLFTIPYQKVGSSYYVSDEPYFSSVNDLQAKESQVPVKTWSGTDNNSASTKKDLDKFTKALFTAYTTDSDTLKLISEGLSLNDSETFQSLDQATYEPKGDTYQAIVQVTMKNELGTHVENYQFTISKQKQSYFATDFKHTLPKGNKE